MKLTATDLGKRYNRQWIFRHLNLEAHQGEMIAITGHNGSGKSTLLRILSGFVTPTAGKIDYSDKTDDQQLSFSYAAPYLNLMDEFTLVEHLNFHSRFKKPVIAQSEMIEKSGLSGADNKLVKDFSSGMRQRLRLMLAFFYESKIIFLDEPTANLDQNGASWYLEMLSERRADQIVFVASNDPREYQNASRVLSIEDFKLK